MDVSVRNRGVMGGNEEQDLPRSQPVRRAHPSEAVLLQNCDICSPLGHAQAHTHTP